MACSYSFNIPVDPIALMPMVRQEIEQNGGIVTGEAPNLSVTIPTKVGEIRGTCSLVGGSVVNIVVTKKPDIVSCNMVREKLVFYLTEAVKTHAQEFKAAKQKAAKHTKDKRSHGKGKKIHGQGTGCQPLKSTV